ncbi:hypothetical protein [Winogradskyella poriferorum]|uniref:hypothetical protein n=1 Tax=Winogradskyella poriferorum TaxID=307627 RepID=UPI003D65C405
MKRLNILLLVLLTFYTCQKYNGKQLQPTDFLLEDSDVVLKINALNEFKNGVFDNSLFYTIYNKEYSDTQKVLNYLLPSPSVYIAFRESNDSNPNTFITAQYIENTNSIDSTKFEFSKKPVDSDIYKSSIDSLLIFYHKIENIFLTSNNQSALELIIDDYKSTKFERLFESTNQSAIASAVFKLDSSDISKILLKDHIYDDYAVLDFNTDATNFNFSGVITQQDSVSNILKNFKKVAPQKVRSLGIVSNKTKSLIALTLDNYKSDASNDATKDSLYSNETASFLNYCSEVSETENGIYLFSLDPELLMESLENKSYEETFREVDIFQFPNPNYFDIEFETLLNYKDAHYCFHIGNYVVFSNTIENCSAIITDYLNGNTLGDSEQFASINEKLSDESSLFIYKDGSTMSDYLNSDLSKYNVNAVQYIFEDDYALANGIFKNYKQKSTRHSVTEMFNTAIEDAIISGPHILVNHLNKTKDIAIQDINNVLYLVSNSGKILWKKKLQSQILGAIEQIDMYKNGRLQLAFTTSNRLYVIDRNGNDVNPFPLKFNDAITQPLSVFDYDNNRDFRLLITQANELLMYTAKGASVTGFDYKSTSDKIKTQPKHFRIDNKDYIVFATDKTMKILNRRGKIRVDIKDNIRISDNSIFLHKNKFTTTNTKGELVQVNTKGEILRKQLDLITDHNIDATSKTLVSLSDNELRIRSNRIELDFGSYTKPKIFYLNDKIYVTTTDSETNKVYLFDSQGQAIPNFPIYGNSSAELSNLDRDRNVELIVLGNDNTLLSYKIN